MACDVNNTIAKRVAHELKDNQVVNLGIGIPTFVSNHIPEHINVYFHGENGILGLGPVPAHGMEDPNVFDAGAAGATVIPGGSFMDSSQSFALIRSGRIDVTVLGALQVDERGNLANWTIPGKMTVGFGGAVDLVTCAGTVIVAMKHTNKGAHKIMTSCSLPLTGAHCVRYIVTEMGFMEVTEQGIVLKEVAEGLTVQDVQKATDARLIIPERIGIMPIVAE
ncbi:3-oxoacid CoA-transferase subunit B [Enterocloster aldenensis]|uniref:3-oxoacid CoA-transferase subunit B n=1 Tax=Enterocloster aldenensis TaxID=358742 RepID=UPI000E4A9900|nr:3-oxoacid CoA-transferase subunit B [Enterocloster aldenensis]